MAAEPQPSTVSYDAYLESEAASEVKHEFLRGELYAMAGGTPEHAALAMTIGAELNYSLRGRPCRVYSSDLRVRVEATDLSTYPDLAVVRGALETSAIDPNAAINPVVIVEVLSDSTEGYDRGEKFAHYRQIPSLREYILVSQQTRRLESHYKNDAGEWVLREAGPGAALELRALEDVRLETDVVYHDPLAAG